MEGFPCQEGALPCSKGAGRHPIVQRNGSPSLWLSRSKPTGLPLLAISRGAGELASAGRRASVN
jgi:hypothetical protein